MGSCLFSVFSVLSGVLIFSLRVVRPGERPGELELELLRLSWCPSMVSCAPRFAMLGKCIGGRDKR